MLVAIDVRDEVVISHIQSLRVAFPVLCRTELIGDNFINMRRKLKAMTVPDIYVAKNLSKDY